MKLAILLILCSIFLPSCNKSEGLNPPIEVDLGEDATILCGDTLTLDAGAGYDTYMWKDSLSETQQLDVTDPGWYWVNVTQGDRIATDSIFVDVVTESLTVMPNDTCNYLKEVPFFEQYSLMLPCYYVNTSGGGIDSESFRARIIEDNHEIVDIGFERDSRYKQDTIRTLPDVLRNRYNEKIKICNKSGEGIGVLFYRKINTTYIDYNGIYLSEEDDVYFEILTVAYQETREKEVKNILSTIKISDQ